MPIALMFVILYFLMIRPQQKRAREHETMVQNLKRGDDVVTHGGIHGRIQAIADKILTVEIAAQRPDSAGSRSGRERPTRRAPSEREREGEGMKLGYRVHPGGRVAPGEQRLSACPY